MCVAKRYGAGTWFAVLSTERRLRKSFATARFHGFSETGKGGRDNMKMKLLGTLTAVVLIGLGAQASTTSTDLGDLSAGDTAGASLLYTSPGLTVDDTWTFTLNESLLTGIVIDSGDLNPFFGIEGLTASDPSGMISFTFDAAD